MSTVTQGTAESAEITKLEYAPSSNTIVTQSVEAALAPTPSPVQRLSAQPAKFTQTVQVVQQPFERPLFRN